MTARPEPVDPPAPALTSAAVLEAARTRGIPMAVLEPGSPAPTKILLASLGFDLRSTTVVRQLVELNRCGEIALRRVDMPGLCTLSLIGRGLPTSLLDDSKIVDGPSMWHAVELPTGGAS